MNPLESHDIPKKKVYAPACDKRPPGTRRAEPGALAQQNGANLEDSDNTA